MKKFLSVLLLFSALTFSANFATGQTRLYNQNVVPLATADTGTYMIVTINTAGTFGGTQRTKVLASIDTNGYAILIPTIPTYASDSAAINVGHLQTGTLYKTTTSGIGASTFLKLVPTH